MQYDISKALENLAIVTTIEEYLLTQITSTIKQLGKTNNILIDKIKTLTATNERLTENGEHHQKQGGHATTVNDYEFKVRSKNILM